MTEDGHVIISGRISDMICRGGENVYPLEVEEFLYTHPDIEEVQVVGVPDKKFGEEICAWVVLKEGRDLSERDLKMFCDGQISRFKTPKHKKQGNQTETSLSNDISWQDIHSAQVLQCLEEMKISVVFYSFAVFLFLCRQDALAQYNLPMGTAPNGLAISNAYMQRGRANRSTKEKVVLTLALQLCSQQRRLNQPTPLLNLHQCSPSHTCFNRGRLKFTFCNQHRPLRRYCTLNHYWHLNHCTSFRSRSPIPSCRKRIHNLKTYPAVSPTASQPETSHDQVAAPEKPETYAAQPRHLLLYNADPVAAASLRNEPSRYSNRVERDTAGLDNSHPQAATYANSFPFSLLQQTFPGGSVLFPGPQQKPSRFGFSAKTPQSGQGVDFVRASD
ncbi:hypothetical protein MTO96_000817 [Rhipicephalus appendiculatus]